MPIVSLGIAFAQPSPIVWPHTLEVLVPRYLATTLQLAFLVAVLSVVFGTCSAWLITMCRFPGRRLLEPLLVVPLALPAYVLAYVYLDLLGPSGPVQPWLRATLGQTVSVDVASTTGAGVILAAALFPYVYVLARSAFLQRSGTFFEISRSLGVGPWRGFVRVSLPLARPALAAGAALVVMETLADFGAVSLLGVDTFTTGIYRAWFSMGDPVAAARLAALLVVTVFAILILERSARAGAAYAEARTNRERARFELTGARATSAFLFCALPVLVGFALPTIRLLWLAIDTSGSASASALPSLIANSLLLGGGTGALAVVLALILAYAARPPDAAAARWGARVAGLGYAVPGPVVAIGVLSTLGAVDAATSTWLAEFGVGGTLLLSGTVAALVYAYLVRFMTVSLGTVEAGLAAVRPSLDEAAATLGSGFIERLFRIHAPLAWPALTSAFLLVAVDVIKELPATLVLRPFDFDTLAVRTYALARDERLAEAAAPALALVSLGLVPVLLLLRTMRRERG